VVLFALAQAMLVHPRPANGPHVGARIAVSSHAPPEPCDRRRDGDRRTDAKHPHHAQIVADLRSQGQPQNIDEAGYSDVVSPNHLDPLFAKRPRLVPLAGEIPILDRRGIGGLRSHAGNLGALDARTPTTRTTKISGEPEQQDDEED
jgi:hypothetical protein